MQKIRVFVVDDSAVMRRLLTDTLEADPELTVVATAPNGRIALAKLQTTVADVITMDVEMPEMDGLETVMQLRRSHPNLPVIMVSAVADAGAAVTLEALAHGASDYVTKPSGGIALAKEHFRTELIPKLKLFARLSEAKGRTDAFGQSKMPASGSFRPRAAPPEHLRAVPDGRRVGRVDIVALGISTGGPNALHVLIPALPKTLAVPVVLVQHMPPVFTARLAERLEKDSAVTVREAAAGDELRAGVVYIAPGNFHMTVGREGTKTRIGVNQAPPENSCRPAADVLFRSVAAVYGRATLAVVMTGMGKDGYRGCEAIKAVHGQVIVQDEATSVVWGMPGFVAKARLADDILPLDQLALEIVRRVAVGREAPNNGARV
jgi:two-component system chemotaxis response regulator CheB